MTPESAVRCTTDCTMETSKTNLSDHVTSYMILDAKSIMKNFMTTGLYVVGTH